MLKITEEKSTIYKQFRKEKHEIITDLSFMQQFTTTWFKFRLMPSETININLSNKQIFFTSKQVESKADLSSSSSSSSSSSTSMSSNPYKNSDHFVQW